MVILSNNPMTVVGLEGYGLKIVSRRPIPELET
jgi:GTP cyclohydrolase II